jgi:hypothetical protein
MNGESGDGEVVMYHSQGGKVSLGR